MAAVHEITRKWSVSCKFFTHHSGWLVFKFNSEHDRDRVLNGGPYVIYGRPLLLKIMPSCFEFDDAEVSMMPVWVTLPGLPLDCWTQNALYKIGRKIGRPLATDEVTSNKERIAFARLLVEADISKELVRSVNIRLPSGKLRQQRVVYEFIPKFCSTCRRLGDATENCDANEKMGAPGPFKPNPQRQPSKRTSAPTKKVFVPKAPSKTVPTSKQPSDKAPNASKSTAASGSKAPAKEAEEINVVETPNPNREATQAISKTTDNGHQKRITPERVQDQPQSSKEEQLPKEPTSTNSKGKEKMTEPLAKFDNRGNRKGNALHISS
ncbi:hypothetical protein PHJA_002496500 [Phtheirospermum japonicum]|uniref:DUF4283 domain-containing protein n=1 Tax=Phtheirospermum japonicum TaxID=374723 RepID=A0A830CWE3_9LAMI|nr:hypothetical protein PHJA_002496500 [Phtheirospermum japonicum]